MINQNWYTRNEGIDYPIDETASLLDNNGQRLPSDLIADLKLKFPNTLDPYPFLASVTVTSTLVTITIETADALTGPTQFTPLAVASVRQPIVLGQHVPLQGQMPGVGGWVVFGRGAADRIPYQSRFDSPLQSLLTARAGHRYCPLPVTGLRDIRTRTLLTGVVRWCAEAPLKISKESRDIDDIERDVIVLRLIQDADLNPDVLHRFAGPCAGRPESKTCGDAQPIEFINSVGPDCNGQITLHFKNCVVAQIEDPIGALLDVETGLSEACLLPHLPDENGVLPGEICQTSFAFCDLPITASQEVPPTASLGFGTVNGTLNTVTNTFAYTITYTGLTGPLIGAHFHLAPIGVDGPIIEPILIGPSPITGVWNYPEVQEANLLNGLFYVNLHTAFNPGGEIRGQLTTTGVC